MATRRSWIPLAHRTFLERRRQAPDLTHWHGERRVNHTQRLEDLPLQILAEPLAGDGFYHQSRDVKAEAIVPLRAGLVLQRQTTQFGQKLACAQITRQARILFAQLGLTLTRRSVGDARRM